MSYRLEVADSISQLKNGDGVQLGAISRLRAFRNRGPIKQIEVVLSNLDNKFQIGIAPIIKAGQFFRLSVNDKPYLSGSIEEASAFEGRDSLTLIGFSLEKRLQRKAGAGTRVAPARQTNGEVIQRMFKVIYRQEGFTFNLEETTEIFDNNGIIENEFIEKRVNDILEREGFLFFITPDFEVNFVRKFKPSPSEALDFVHGQNMGEVRPEISTELLKNHITVIGTKMRKERNSKTGSNKPSAYITAISVNNDSIDVHGFQDKKIRAPQLKSKEAVVDLADRILEEENKIEFKFLFKAPFGIYDSNAFYNLTYRDYGLILSPDWKIDEVELISSVTDNFALISLEKRFPAPFDGIID